MSGILYFDVTQGCKARFLVDVLVNWVEVKSDLDPISLALVDKIQTLCPDNPELTKQFAVAVSKLNPLAIGVSRIPLSFSADDEDQDRILNLSKGLPTRETEWPGPSSDALGIAMLKTVAHDFGARGNSVLIKMARAETVRALWCEPAPIETRVVEGKPKIFSLVGFEALLGSSIDVQELIRCLTNLGAREVFTMQVMELGSRHRTQIRGLVSFDMLEQVIEKLLIDGEASQVTSSCVDLNSLRMRRVEVPFGRGQMQQSCAVIESMWGERVLRAELAKEDLAALVKTTGFSPESIRSDVISAWKKLR